MGPGKGICLELPEPVTLVYEKPGHCWMRIPKRKWNPFLALAEIIWILSGNGSVEWISYYSSKMRDFQDGDHPDFHGAYGLRIRQWETGGVGTIDQIGQVIKKLRENPNSRQAIINLWDPIKDNLFQSKDYPCNNWVGYTLRNNVLDQTVVIRSNDLVWGTPINAVQFTHIQAYVAGCLGVAMGKLTYVINNLHYYQELYKPTLTNLIEQAYGSQPLRAERAERFSTFSDRELLPLGDEPWIEPWRGSMPIDKSSNPTFIERDLPYLLWIYSYIKRDEGSKQFNPKQIAILLESIGQPFIGLVTDFYSSSKNEFVQSVLSYL